jgi:hypothetical protein
MVSAAVDMMNKAGESSKPTTHDVVAFADREGHLARQASGRVCAAPTRLIERTIAVILTGEGGDASRSGLAQLVEFPPLWEFCRLQDSLGATMSGYRAVLEDLSRKGNLAGPQELFSCVVVISGVRRSFGEFTESVLNRVTLVQAQANRVLGRSGDAPPITFEQLVGML